MGAVELMEAVLWEFVVGEREVDGCFKFGGFGQRGRTNHTYFCLPSASALIVPVSPSHIYIYIYTHDLPFYTTFEELSGNKTCR